MPVPGRRTAIFCGKRSVFLAYSFLAGTTARRKGQSHLEGRNKNLRTAKRIKNDEFYTQESDIEVKGQELRTGSPFLLLVLETAADAGGQSDSVRRLSRKQCLRYAGNDAFPFLILSCPLPDTFWQRIFFIRKNLRVRQIPRPGIVPERGIWKCPGRGPQCGSAWRSPGFAGASATSKPSDAWRALSL